MFQPLLLLLLFTVSHCAQDDDAVDLRDVKVLTLHDGRMTTGRRADPVPQLVCVDGGACRHTALRPRVVQCYNQGHDGQSYQWKCEADLDASVRLGRVTVTCEGYSYSGDRRVLKGSCGLEYTLERTPVTVPKTVATTTTTTTIKQPPPPPIQHTPTNEGVAFHGVVVVLSVIAGFIFVVWVIAEYGCPPLPQDRIPYTPVSRTGHDRAAEGVRYRHTTVSQPVVVVQQPSSSSSYTEGFVMGNLAANYMRPTEPTTVTTTPTPVTQKSTAYGGTKSRGTEKTVTWQDQSVETDTRGDSSVFTDWVWNSVTTTSGDTTVTHKSTAYGDTKSR